MTPSDVRAAAPRFFFVDTLRALACVSVMFFHIICFSPLTEVYAPHGSFLSQCLFGLGKHGVDIFFVISGFVIAYSLRADPLTLASIGRFILRRQVRLDPPYWAALLLVSTFLVAEHFILGAAVTPLPTKRAVLLNALYLHRIFHGEVPGILMGMAWTLCLEIQFYLLFILILWLTHRRGEQGPGASDSLEPTHAVGVKLSSSAVAVVWLSGVACLGIKLLVVNTIYFWSAWHFFVAGVLVCWTLTRGVRPLWLWSFLLMFALSWVFSFVSHPIFVDPIFYIASPTALFIGAATALLIYGMGRVGKLDWGEHWRSVQFLGRISYSLYLTHPLVLFVVLRVARKLTGVNFAAALLWFPVTALCCVGFAAFFHAAIERRGLQWASALRLNREATPVPVTPTRLPVDASTITQPGTS